MRWRWERSERMHRDGCGGLSTLRSAEATTMYKPTGRLVSRFGEQASVRHTALLAGCFVCLCVTVLVTAPLPLLRWWQEEAVYGTQPSTSLSAEPSLNSADTVIPLPTSFASHFHLSPSSATPLPVVSSHRCIGPDVQYSSGANDHISRRCVFHNVCLNSAPPASIANYNASDVQGSGDEVHIVLDYLRPATDVPAGWAEPLQPLDARSPARPLVALRHGGRAERQERLRSLVVNVRSSWDETRARRFVPGVHALHQLLASGDMNFGHFLLDDAYAVWETVRSFDPVTSTHHSRSTKPNSSADGDERLYARDSVQVLLITACADYAPQLQPLCTKFAASLFPVVSSRPVLGLQSAYSHYGVSPQTEQLCFETLIAGSGNAGAVGWGPNNRDRAAAFAAFRADMYAAHGLDPYRRPAQHHLVLVDKRGRRGFANVRAAYEQLKLTPRYADVRMTVVDDFKQWTFAEQLRLLQSATIVLSPCGGISMLFLLLPHRSTLIVSTYPERSDNGSIRSVRMEGALWEWQANVRVVHYPLLDESDFVMPPGVKQSKYGLRNHASTVLKMSRLRYLLDQAILKAAAPF